MVVPKLAPALCLLALLACAAGEPAPQSAPCEGGDWESCATQPSSSVLQRSTSAADAGKENATSEEGDAEGDDGEELLEDVVDDDESANELGEEKEKEKVDEFSEGFALLGTAVEMHNGVRIFIHEGSDVVTTGRGVWVITIPEGCTTDDVRQMAEHMPKDSIPVFEGHPDKGGLCVFMMLGTIEDVKQELDTHTWRSTPVVTTDVTRETIPEIHSEHKPGLIESDSQPASWGLDRIDDLSSDSDHSYEPPTEWNGGEGVKVFVLDTGIRTTHNDFQGRAIPSLESLSQMKECNGDASCADDVHGHGTHCAGTIAGVTYGVAKKATVHAVKVLDNHGRGYASWGIKAIDWIMTNRQGPTVLSMSLGGSGNNAAEKVAIDKIIASGVTVVAAAGNAGSDACGYSPAWITDVITVGASSMDDSVPWFSNIGRCVDIFAPGVNIVSTSRADDAASWTMSGTSMACPHVSGVAALILGQDSGKRPNQVLHTMLEMATPDKLTGTINADSPNLLLYMGEVPEMELPTPPPTTTLAPAPEEQPAWAGRNLPCTFEAGFQNCAWKNMGGDQANWRRGGRGPASEGQSGPSAAFDGSFYMKLKITAAIKQGDEAALKSDRIVVGPRARLKFAYFIGQRTGGLLVRVNGRAKVFDKTGRQGSGWRMANISLKRWSGKTIWIKLSAVMGDSKTGDIAIDAAKLIDVKPA
mmetsp:Transcript_83074/g.220410  ORF Transcript_83074/g.220410 Transcript_83074/m.220410 type:complete len:699 (-) Transcript_83074:153-2249(-)